MFKGLRKSPSEKANELLGKAKLSAQKGNYKEAHEFANKAAEIFKDEVKDRKKVDFAKALVYEYKGELSIKKDKAREAANFLGRAGGFYQRLNMTLELERVYLRQAQILRIIAKRFMKDRQFLDAASFFEQAAMCYMKLKMNSEAIDCKAKSYVSRAAAEQSISGRKVYLKKAVELIGEKGSDEPVIKGHLAYYNALFNEVEKPEKALRFYAEALQYYQVGTLQSRIDEIKKKIGELTKDI